MSYLAVFLGGGLGSLVRFGLSKWAIASGKEQLWGTLAANVIACFFLGYLAFALSRENDSIPIRLLLATGFCGGFSTFSTFSLEAVSLFQAGRFNLAVFYITASLVLGISAILLSALLWK